MSLITVVIIRGVDVVEHRDFYYPRFTTSITNIDITPIAWSTIINTPAYIDSEGTFAVIADLNTVYQGD